MKALCLAVLLFTSVFAVQLQTEMQALTSGPADLLIEHLERIEASLYEEVFKHDQLNESQTKECDDEIAIRTQAIKDGTDAKTFAQSHLTRCQDSQKQAVSDLATAKQYLMDVKNEKAKLTSDRQKEKFEFDNLIQYELTPAIDAVKGAIPLVEALSEGGSSFLQTTKYMTSTFVQLMKSGKAHLMAPVLAELAASGQGFNPEDVARVKQLFEKLLSDLENARLLAQQIELQRVDLYTQNISKLDTIEGTLTSTIEALEKYQSEMESCIAQETAIIDEATLKVINNTAALDHATTMCNAFKVEYESAKKGRETELTLLAKLKVFIKEQADIFGEYGNEGSNVFDEYKKSYSNQVNGQAQMFIQMRAQKEKIFAEKINQPFRF